MNMNVAAESDENDHIVGIEADRLDFFLEMVINDVIVNDSYCMTHTV